MKKDFLGNVLKVGDTIVFMIPNYRSLASGKIIKLNDKKLTIEYYDRGIKRTFMQFYDQVVKA